MWYRGKRETSDAKQLKGAVMTDALEKYKTAQRVDRLVELALQDRRIMQGVIATLYADPKDGIDGRCAAEILRLKLYVTSRIESDQPLHLSPKLQTLTRLSDDAGAVLASRYRSGALGLHPVP